MANINRLSGFAVVNFNGGDRVSFTYDTIDQDGNLVSQNNKKSFYAVDETLNGHISAIKSFINARMEEGE